MPFIDVSIAEGRTPDELRAFITALHHAAEQTVGATPDNTVVVLREVPTAHWSRGDVTIAERRAGA
ncbi:MAG: tautomerase family protein [Pseudoclavibacter sp.]